MNKIISYFLILIGIVFISSCEIIEPQDGGNYYIDTTPIPPATPDQKVMIIEFTAHQCTYCPNGHRAIEEIIELYGSAIVPIAVHGGYLAEVTPEYPTDFTTETGDELMDYFDPPFQPQGLVNTLEKGNLSNLTAWLNEVQLILVDNASDPEIGIQMENIYNEENRTVSSTIKYKALVNLDYTMKIAVYLIEDSIESPQLDNGEYKEKYMHRHVLRGAVNSTWGDAIFAEGNILQGASEEKVFNMTLDAGWNENQCFLIAFIYDDLTKNVLQVEEADVITEEK